MFEVELTRKHACYVPDCQLLSAIALIKVFEWFNSRYCHNADFTNEPMIDKEGRKERNLTKGRKDRTNDITNIMVKLKSTN